MKPDSVGDHFDRVAPDYDRWKEKAHRYYAALKKSLREIVPPRSRVLEVGCATGDILASLDPDQRRDYKRRADARVLAGQRRLASAIAGGQPLYERPADRRFSAGGGSEKRQEADMLLDPASRLDEGDHYTRSEA